MSTRLGVAARSYVMVQIYNILSSVASEPAHPQWFRTVVSVAKFRTLAPRTRSTRLQLLEQRVNVFFADCPSFRRMARKHCLQLVPVVSEARFIVIASSLHHLISMQRFDGLHTWQGPHHAFCDLLHRLFCLVRRDESYRTKRRTVIRILGRLVYLFVLEREG